MDSMDLAYYAGKIFVEAFQECRNHEQDILHEPRFAEITENLRRLMTDPSERQQIVGFVAASPQERKMMDGSPNIFLDLQAAIYRGEVQERFPVGTVLPDLWVHPVSRVPYYMPHIIVDYRDVGLPYRAKTPGAILLRKFALPMTMSFNDGGAERYVFSSVHKLVNEGLYVRGCSSKLLYTVETVKAPMYYSDNISSGAYECKFFLPSLENLHLNPHDNPHFEELTWEYFKDTPADRCQKCLKRIFSDPMGELQDCWTSTDATEQLYAAWVITLTGAAAYRQISDCKTSCTPACVIIGKRDDA